MGGNLLMVIGSLGLVFAPNFLVMVIMRVIFGSGAEAVFVAISLLIVRSSIFHCIHCYLIIEFVQEEWFRKSKYLGMALGVYASFPLLGTFSM
jgi:hypothetical protein